MLSLGGYASAGPSTTGGRRPRPPTCSGCSTPWTRIPSFALFPDWGIAGWNRAYAALYPNIATVRCLRTGTCCGWCSPIPTCGTCCPTGTSPARRFLAEFRAETGPAAGGRGRQEPGGAAQGGQPGIPGRLGPVRHPGLRITRAAVPPPRRGRAAVGAPPAVPVGPAGPAPGGLHAGARERRRARRWRPLLPRQPSGAPEQVRVWTKHQNVAAPATGASGAAQLIPPRRGTEVQA